MAIKDMTNTMIGDIKVVDFAYMKNKRAYWNCVCSCGKSFIALGKDLRSGNRTHCGCKRLENLSKTLLNKYNLVGKRFGRLVALEQLPKYKGKDTYYKCKCDCGNEKVVSGKSLNDGSTSSCGCYKIESHRKNITGQKFGKLTAIKPAFIDKKQSVVWECECECGNKCNVKVSAKIM